MKTLDEINDYFGNLGVKNYFSLESLTIEEINIIAETYEELHKKYPNVVIEEIGDYYTIDKLSHEEFIKNANSFLNSTDYSKYECYKDNPELIKKSKEILKNNIINKTVNVNDTLYTESSYLADYRDSTQTIRFNHIFHNNVRENMYHEFGHALAYQYDINNNKEINTVFENIGVEKIKQSISEYATTNVKEFIAEIFRKHFIGEQNLLINSIMNIINDEVKNGKAMTDMERFIHNSIYGEI